MALRMSRACVSLDRQAVAPKASIWLDSDGDGRLASTTRRVEGWPACSSRTSAGLRSEPKFRIATWGVRGQSAAGAPPGRRRRGQLEVGIGGDQRPQPARDQILEAGESDGDAGSGFHLIRTGDRPAGLARRMVARAGENG